MWPNDDEDETVELVCLECLAHYRVTGESEPCACVGCGTELVPLESAEKAA